MSVEWSQIDTVREANQFLDNAETRLRSIHYTSPELTVDQAVEASGASLQSFYQARFQRSAVSKIFMDVIDARNAIRNHASSFSASAFQHLNARFNHFEHEVFSDPVFNRDGLIFLTVQFNRTRENIQNSQTPMIERLNRFSTLYSLNRRIYQLLQSQSVSLNATDRVAFHDELTSQIVFLQSTLNQWNVGEVMQALAAQRQEMLTAPLDRSDAQSMNSSQKRAEFLIRNIETLREWQFTIPAAEASNYDIATLRALEEARRLGAPNF